MAPDTPLHGLPPFDTHDPIWIALIVMSIVVGCIIVFFAYVYTENHRERVRSGNARPREWLQALGLYYCYIHKRVHSSMSSGEHLWQICLGRQIAAGAASAGGGDYVDKARGKT